MTTVILVYSGGRSWGGIETYLSNLLELYDRGQMRLVLVSMGRWKLTDELERQGLGEDLRILSGRRVCLETVWDIRRIARVERASVVVSQGVVANAYARLAAWLARVPHLTVVHSDIKLDYGRAVQRCVRQTADRLLRSVTSGYIAVSGYLKESLVRSGVDSARVRVIYNGVKTQADRRFERGVIGSGGPAGVEGEVRLVSVGRLHKVKNFDSLVRAMLLLPDLVRLTVWGEGEERTNLERLVADLSLSDRVRFPGESENMKEVLVGTDIYLQPSWSEGCSFAVAEAMLQGRPTVVSPFGGLPEQVQDGVTGVVTEGGSPEQLAKAIRSLVDDQELRRRLGLAGKEYAEDMYRMDKWLSDTAAAFKDGERAVERAR